MWATSQFAEFSAIKNVALQVEECIGQGLVVIWAVDGVLKVMINHYLHYMNASWIINLPSLTENTKIRHSVFADVDAVRKVFFRFFSVQRRSDRSREHGTRWRFVSSLYFPFALRGEEGLVEQVGGLYFQTKSGLYDHSARQFFQPLPVGISISNLVECRCKEVGLPRLNQFRGQCCD
jgi:hypothetical protein